MSRNYRAAHEREAFDPHEDHAEGTRLASLATIRRIEWTPELRQHSLDAPVRLATLEGHDEPVRVLVLDRRSHPLPPRRAGLRWGASLHHVVLVAVAGEDRPRWIDRSRLIRTPKEPQP